MENILQENKNNHKKENTFVLFCLWPDVYHKSFYFTLNVLVESVFLIFGNKIEGLEVGRDPRINEV